MIGFCFFPGTVLPVGTEVYFTNASQMLVSVDGNDHLIASSSRKVILDKDYRVDYLTGSFLCFKTDFICYPNQTLFSGATSFDDYSLYFENLSPTTNKNFAFLNMSLHFFSDWNSAAIYMCKGELINFDFNKSHLVYDGSYFYIFPHLVHSLSKNESNGPIASYDYPRNFYLRISSFLDVDLSLIMQPVILQGSLIAKKIDISYDFVVF